jgi:hypothetical protein
MAEKGGTKIIGIFSLGIILFSIGLLLIFQNYGGPIDESFPFIILMPIILILLIVVKLEYLEYNTTKIQNFFMIILAISAVYFSLFFILFYFSPFIVSLICSGISLILVSSLLENSKRYNRFIVCFLILILFVPIVYPFLIGPYKSNNRIECGDIDRHYEEPRPIGGNCLEYDFERDILLMGTENGLGLYHTENGTYQLVGNDRINSLSIDYKHDVYYIGTYSLGIKKYDIKSNTYISNHLEFRNYEHIRQLTYNEYTESLIIGEYKSEGSINSAFYDNTSKILFIYDIYKYKFTITYYNNNSNKIIIFLNNEIFRLNFVEDVDIDYDPILNIVFLAFEYNNYYEYKGTSSITQGLIAYNLNTTELSYFNLSGSKERKHPRIQDICINQKEHLLYIATSDSGLFSYNITTKKFNKIRGFKTNYFRSLTLDDQKDILYVTTDTEHLRISSGDTSLSKYYLTNGTIVEL